MRSRTSKTAAATVVVGLALTVGPTLPSQAMTSGGGGIALTTARTVDTETVEVQKVRATARAKGRVLKAAAPLLVTAEVPGEVDTVTKRKRLGLPTWRVVVEMESGYRVAAFVHRRTGVIIDWSVLEVPADVDYTPPKKDPNAPKPDPVKPKPAPVPDIVEQAVEAARAAAAPGAGSAAAPSGPYRDDSSDDHSDDSSDDSRDDHSDDSSDDHSDDSSDDSSDDHSDDSSDDHSDDSSDDSRDDHSDDSRDDRSDDSSDDSSDDD